MNEVNWILIKITPDGNGVRDYEHQVAISKNAEALEDYRTSNNLKEKDKRFSIWDCYYEIRGTNIEIV